MNTWRSFMKFQKATASELETESGKVSVWQKITKVFGTFSDSWRHSHRSRQDGISESNTCTEQRPKFTKISGNSILAQTLRARFCQNRRSTEWLEDRRHEAGKNTMQAGKRRKTRGSKPCRPTHYQITKYLRGYWNSTSGRVSRRGRRLHCSLL